MIFEDMLYIIDYKMDIINNAFLSQMINRA